MLGLAGAFEREAIRPHVLGNFTDLLLAVEQHPAMLLYLDNYLSVGPGSRLARMAARRQTERKIGINENLAREILELHTLGVNGGYTQQDVTTFAQVLTGWSIGGNFGRLQDGEPGQFTFREALHEPGAKTVLGKRYSEDGESEGKAVLRDVAAKPATATFIATKLARHFIADEPPPAAVEKLAKSFTKSHGDLPTVYRTPRRARAIRGRSRSRNSKRQPTTSCRPIARSTFRSIRVDADSRPSSCWASARGVPALPQAGPTAALIGTVLPR